MAVWRSEWGESFDHVAIPACWAVRRTSSQIVFGARRRSRPDANSGPATFLRCRAATVAAFLEVALQRVQGGRRERDPRPSTALPLDREGVVHVLAARVAAEIGEVGTEEFVEPQGVVQQQPQDGGVP